jgi:hypothetical protein
VSFFKSELAEFAKDENKTPMPSYRAGGRQFVAIAAGSAILVFGLAGP